MFTDPYLTYLIVSGRDREWLASAQRQRLARRRRAQARASRPVGRAAQRLRRSLRIATARHPEIPA